MNESMKNTLFQNCKNLEQCAQISTALLLSSGASRLRQSSGGCDSCLLLYLLVFVASDGVLVSNFVERLKHMSSCEPINRF